MSHSDYMPHDMPSPRTSKWLAAIAAAVVVLMASSWFVYEQFRIDVGTGQIAIIINKHGKNLDNGDEIAPGPEYRGVQREYLTEGRDFKNPFYHDWQVIDQIVIPQGRLGIRVSLTGDDLPYGEFLAHLDADGNPTTKGIMPGVLRPGRYPIHPYLFEVDDRHEPITVSAGFKGVVTNLAGPIPDNPNVLLVPDGFRGVQQKAKPPGTYYVNPFEERIEQVDCRSQRFNLAENKDMGFPSKDGFWVSLDGVIEFRVKPEEAAEVFVTYNEETNGPRIDEEIIRKVILPNARSFCRLQGSNELGRQFIQGETRIEFQEKFQAAMRTACEPLGIEIIQALITQIRPPQKIASPVREREIAKQQEKQYQQQILQQESEQKLAIEAELVKRKQAIVRADQEVVKVETEALREQEVAVTKADERLGVAEFKLQAASDEAEAIMSRGGAAAEVVRFKNEADAAGWKRAVEAYGGDGGGYARYVLFQKLASAYRDIMVNTADSPIMRIFESFDQPAGPSNRSPRTAGTSAVAEPPATQTAGSTDGVP